MYVVGDAALGMVRIANLVRFYGKKYVYYDAVALVPSGPTGIGANTIVVDAEELARVVLCLFEQVRDGF